GRGPKKSECLLETVVAGATGGVTVRCKDGDPTCDADPTAGRCGFSLAMCLNNADPRLASCTARGVRRLTASTTGMRGAAARSARADLLAAVAAGTNALTRGPAVILTPPDTSPDRCTAPVTVHVDAKRRGKKLRPGVANLTTRAFGLKRVVDT